MIKHIHIRNIEDKEVQDLITTIKKLTEERSKLKFYQKTKKKELTEVILIYKKRLQSLLKWKVSNNVF